MSYTAAAASVHLSVKVWLCFLLLLIPATLAEENITFEITDFSATQVELTCELMSDENVTGVYFAVRKEGQECLYRTTQECRVNFLSKCDMECSRPKDPKSLQFSVLLDGTCDEDTNIRCTINNITKEQMKMDKSLQITPQSDPPVISVNHGQPVRESCEPVEITCTVENICNKNRLDISGVGLAMKDVTTIYTQEGNRFTAIAKSKAIFKEPGNHIIACKESEKEDIFSRKVTVSVDPDPQAVYGSNCGNNEKQLLEAWQTGLLTGAMILGCVTCLVLVILWRKRRLKVCGFHDLENGNMSESEKMLASTKRYEDIESKILHLNSSNLLEEQKKILKLLDEEEITFPESGNSFIYHLIKKVNELYRDTSIRELNMRLWECYKKSDLSKTEDLSERIWKKMGRHIKTESEGEECIKKLKILLPDDAELSTRLMWRFVKRCEEVHEQQTWNSHAAVLKYLLKQKADPYRAVEHDEASAFTTFIKRSDKFQLDSLVSACIGETVNSSNTKSPTLGKSVLNDIVKSVPDINYFCHIKEYIAEMSENNPSLCDHRDSDNRTPLHNLMKKIFFDGVGWNMPESDSLQILGELTMQLATPENVKISDKDGITPYSWVLFELLSSNDLSKEVLYPQHTKSLTAVCDNFEKKGAEVDEAYKGFNSVAYRKIENVIMKMHYENRYTCTKLILDILDEFDITYPETGKSIICQLVEKTNELYERTSFVILVKALYPSYQNTTLYENEDIAESFWKHINVFPIDEAKEMECIYKLKVFIHLEDDLPTRLLKKFTELSEEHTRNPHFINVVIFLIKEGADSFQQHKGSSIFSLLLEGSAFEEQKIIMTSVFANSEKSHRKEPNDSVLNDMIKSVPRNHHFCHFKEHITEMIKNNPDLCDNVDSDKRTPLHNLMMQIFVDDVGWNTTKTDHPGDHENLVELTKQLATTHNVNLSDKDGVTPYTWICLEKVSIGGKGKQLSKEMLQIENNFLDKDAKEEKALTGIQVVGMKRLQRLLEKIMQFDASIVSNFTGPKEKASTFIESLQQEVKIDCQRIANLKNEGYGSDLEIIQKATESSNFVRHHIEILNEEVSEISQVIVGILIDKCNAQEIYNILKKHANNLRKGGTERLNYFALWNMIEQCLNKGATPAKSDIIEIFEHNILKPMFRSQKALFHMFQRIEQLISVYRQYSKSDSIEIYLNPLQDQYKVDEDLRTVACKIIEGAYSPSFNSNNKKSDSVINILLSLKKDDAENVNKTYFEMAETLLSKKSSDNEKSYGKTGKSQRKKLIERNSNWFKRNLLHLAAIFCHDQDILSCIPEKLIREKIEETDIHGSTPLHIAYLHHNKSAIKLFESFCMNREIQDYFGKGPESYEDSDTDHGTQRFEDTCRSILHTKSSVFDIMKQNLMLVFPVKEREHMPKIFEELIDELSKLRYFEVKLGGSMREMLKVGRPDEFDLQICCNNKEFLMNDSARQQVNEILFKEMTEAYKKKIPLRLITFGNPWKFIWEERGCYQDLEITGDIELFCHEEIKTIAPKRLEELLEYQIEKPCLIYLKVDDFGTPLYWSKTMCRYEWALMDSLPHGCRIGILIAKVLLEALVHTSKYSYRRVNTQGIKNAMFFLLAGKTPMQIQNVHGNVIKEKYGAKTEKFHLDTNQVPTWTTEEDLMDHDKMEEGRMWAEMVFDAIKMIASEYGGLIGEFLLSESRELHPLEPWQLYDVIETCEICLERLKTNVFFGTA